MQSCKLICDANSNERSKSSTKFSKIITTNMAASVNIESCDKTQESNKRKSQVSIYSVTPTNSNVNISRNQTHNQASNRNLNIPNNTRNVNGKESGDKEKGEIESDILLNEEHATEQPEIIFEGNKNNKRTRITSNRFSKGRSNNNKPVVKIHNICFKYNNPHKRITKKLGNYCKKDNRYSINCEKMQKLGIDSSSKLVNTCIKLKKAFAKENLFEDKANTEETVSEEVNCNTDENELSVEEGDEVSVSSPSTIRATSFISTTSTSTLTNNESEIASTHDYFFNATSNISVIQPTSLPVHYEPNNVNVSVVQISNYCKPKDSQETFVIPNPAYGLPTNCQNDESNFYSDKVCTGLTTCEISQSETDEDKTYTRNLDGEYLSTHMSDNDNDIYAMARTSSEFNNSSLDFTVTPNNSDSISSTIYLDKIHPSPSFIDNFVRNDISSNKPTVLDTVINMEMFPEITPSTSSGYQNKCNKCNDIIVASNLIQHFSNVGKINIIDNQTNHVPMNVLKKTFDVDKGPSYREKIVLPNENTLTKMVKEAEILKEKTFPEELKHTDNLLDLSELWDKLILVLDLAVKRLEETLAQRVTEELRKSLPILVKTFSTSKIKTPTGSDSDTAKVAEETVSSKNTFVEKKDIKCENESLQCNLEHNKVIDELIMRLSTEKSSNIKLLEDLPDINKVFKSSRVKSDSLDNIVIKGQTAAVSAEMKNIINGEKNGRIRCFLKSLVNPVQYVTQNSVVISSVPTFFVILFIIYVLIAIIVKPMSY